ncbi:alpha-galactosidase [Plantactinospora endophytica]|uniref:Alpha-galactosidase n=1 Tax=Plantactinospora endophytica TaxID=673535 RepID=A0ABQ4EC81_9ACTN|nr:alpha-galactosidase [Plantactinospora endophytica]GIG92347.1 alpha-galactosidase [Plantactinospora endophytica]
MTVPSQTRPPASDPVADGGLVHLRRAGVSLLLDGTDPGIPAVLHWGADLGPLTGPELADLGAALRRPARPGTPEGRAVGILPEHTYAWFGRPGLSGHRAGRDWSPRFRRTDLRVRDGQDDTGATIVVTATDDAARLDLVLELELDPAGLLRLRAELANPPDADPYQLDGLVLGLPVPPQADELLDLTGRWCRERAPQRTPFTVGTRSRESRRGKPGLDASLLMVAGTAGFGFRSGDVWGVHLGWSGNHRIYAERTPDGEAVLGAGELLLPGEITLAPGERYRTPWLYASYGHGLDELSGRFHAHLRRTAEPERRARPVVVNTWEAVYFDHDLDRLTALADAAARVGAERFVLDDGWFLGRRNDQAGLGDWYVDPAVWPDGLHPLVAHVRGLGLEFGLWVEPEMVNPDSELARTHPEWILATGDRMPRQARWQQVLDLTHPEAYAHVLGRLDALVREYEIAYLKWDHNRDLLDAGHQPSGRPGVHGQTLATYRLLDTLRERHPGLQIESCSSGGGRVDLGILERTDRIWGSDCIDALERQSIQRWTQLLLPPELIGSHVGSARAHTTGRTHDLGFRAGTAFFGSFGIEWDITAASAEEERELTWWVALYKRHRTLVHGGTVVRVDHPDPALWVHGVVAPDRSEAIMAIVATATGTPVNPGPVRLAGLDPDRRYLVRVVAPENADRILPAPPAWTTDPGVRLTGRALAHAGLQAPPLRPEQLLLVHLDGN